MFKHFMIVMSLIGGMFLTANVQASDHTGAYLEITLQIDDANRGAAVDVYKKYKQPFLTTINGAQSKVLLVRTDDVQVVHGFHSVEEAEAYLKSDLFNNDVVRELGPLLAADPEVRIYTVF